MKKLQENYLDDLMEDCDADKTTYKLLIRMCSILEKLKDKQNELIDEHNALIRN